MSADTSPCPLVKNTDWETFYPRQQYVDKTAKAMSLALHYLLAQNQPDTTIISFIQQLQAKNSPKLCAIDLINKRWTPLIIAVMKGREAVVEALLTTNAKDQINHPDEFGWTALHHAALGADGIYRKLIADGADQECRNALLGTPSQLYALTHIPGRRNGSTSINVDGTAVPVDRLDPSEIKARLGLDDWREVPYYPAPFCHLLWGAMPERSPFEERTRKLYRDYCARPPQLIIQREPGIRSGAVLGVVAGEKILPGQVICEYAGNYKFDDTNQKEGTLLQRLSRLKENAYYFDPYDALHLGNASRMINCGWPCGITVDIFADGCKRLLLVAGREIEAGEPLYWDYGISSWELTLGVQSVLGEEKMLQYFSAGIEKLLADFGRTAGRASEDVETGYKLGLMGNRLLFPLGNPAALLKLHFTGLVKAQQWKSLISDRLSENALLTSWAQQNAHGFWIVFSILNRVIEFDDFLTQNPARLKPCSEWVQESIGNLTMLQILKGMARIQEALPTADNWPGFKAALTDELSRYIPTEEENGPLSMNQRAEDHLKELRSKCSSLEMVRMILLRNRQQLLMMDENISETSEAFLLNRTALEKLEGLKPA